MKFSVTSTLLVLIVVLTSGQATSQVRRIYVKQSYVLPGQIKPNVSKRAILPGLTPDPDRIYKSRSTYVSMPVSSTALLGEFFWLGSVTQQSYNKGKIGRFYYWDVQGNLRGSYLFLDIAGKGRRGLKLVFPRHRSLF